MKYLTPNGLYSTLECYTGSNAYPMHMPGHKRNCGMLGDGLPYGIDITEIDGFDDLHQASGILRRASEKAAKLYGSEHAYMIVNGSTCGILSAVSSVVHRGDTVIAARNCHKSVYNACALSELDVRFVYPPMTPLGVCGSISPESVRAALEDCMNAKAVIITSPTYEGVVSDIETIAQICHEKGAVLIVDSAHGAHLPFCTFGKRGEPISSGADIVITSLHKTLPSLTQTAAAFVNGELVSFERFERCLGIFETSSPSYILMSSMDACFDFLANSKREFASYESLLSWFSKETKKLKKLRVLCHGGDTPQDNGFYSFDKGKIVISTSGTNITGVELQRRLREEYMIELEMAYPTYALAMTSVCDTREGFERLASALLETDNDITQVKRPAAFPSLPKPMRLRLTNSELDNLPDTVITREQASSGRFISRKYVYAYPPGIPIVAPGEIIGVFEYDYIELLKKSGVKVVGI